MATHKMYYRRKILLSYLQAFGELEKIKLQKLLFLHRRECNPRKSYDFVPYKFGCFSFQAQADLRTLKKYEIVKELKNSWLKIDDVDYFDQLDFADQKTHRALFEKHEDDTSSEMIRKTYVDYPYYAINSTVVAKHLSKAEISNLDAHRNHDEEVVLFTIGYEGISLETYLNRLIKNNVKALCDVRRNAKSMKYGFSKKQLTNACNGVGIEYVHIPEVGIQSDRRRELNSQKDYDLLFEDYVSFDLKKSQDSQKQILDLLNDRGRIALTCFEAKQCQCHRLPLAKSIAAFPGFESRLQHL